MVPDHSRGAGRNRRPPGTARRFTKPATTEDTTTASRQHGTRLPRNALPSGGYALTDCGADHQAADIVRPTIILQVDGTPGSAPRGIAGIGIVVRNLRGRILLSRAMRASAGSNNEAEYQAVIAGLSILLQRFPGTSVRCLTDSRIVVEQLAGRAQVRAPKLIPLHARALVLSQQFVQLEFVLIPRELNQLADALAWEALDGRGWIARSCREPGIENQGSG